MVRLRALQLRRSMAAVFGLIQGFAHSLLDFVYPPRCLLCDGNLQPKPPSNSFHRAFCNECRSNLFPVADNACRCCGASLGPYTVSEEGCPLCVREHFAFDEVIRLGVYRDELRTACLMAKNPAGTLLGRALTELLMEVNESAFACRSFDVIVPVPEHWLKRLTRPQYAAETMARELSRRLNVRLRTGILAKHRWTPKQAKSPPAERRQQQHGAFSTVRRSSLKGQTVLLVDDILTTGATASETARALKRAGAKRVIVVVLAVSPPSA